MSRGDPKQGERGTFWGTAILLPVAEGVDADAHGSGEAGLGQPDESSQCGDVIARFESALDQAFTNARGNGPGELLCGELGDVSHVCFFRCERKRPCSDRVAHRAEMILTTSSSRSVQITRTKP